MGVPKRRQSKQRGRQRRAASYKISAPALVNCPQCRALIRPHHLCPECGYYKAREVIATK
ncbi:MAG: 50S ribosomal protein L32 [Peptococcaceae bacterium]|nr:50S ribosomal protein L32 [Peptococcaceae bacterium]